MQLNKRTVFQMNTIKRSIFKAVIWYTIVMLCISMVLNSFSIILGLLKGEIGTIFTAIFSLIFFLIFFFIAIKLLKEQNTKKTFYIVLLFWIAQVVFFGIKGNAYAFTSGPQIAIYFRYVGSFEFDVLLRYWSQELSFDINTVSDRIYFGLNLIPLLISLTLIYIYKENQQLQKALDKEDNS